MTETLRFDPSTPAGHCGACRRQLRADEQRLVLALVKDGVRYDVTFCRPCLAEHAPAMLAELETT